MKGHMHKVPAVWLSELQPKGFGDVQTLRYQFDMA